MLSTKNSRAITVQGKRFRWSVSQDSGYVVLVVQQAEGEGQRLEASIHYNAEDEEALAIGPGRVAQIMKSALDVGWKPQLRHAPLQVTVKHSDSLDVRRGLAD